METITIPKNEYKDFIERQLNIEKELNMLKRILVEDDENRISPRLLKRWERISQSLDERKGKSFTSVKKMKVWLKRI